MKHKNADQTFGNFISQWTSIHIGALILMVVVYGVLIVPLLTQLHDIMKGTLSYPWTLYSSVIPGIIIIVPFIGLAMMQSRTSLHTLRVLPKRWAVYSAIGILLGGALYALIFSTGLLTIGQFGMPFYYRLPYVFVGLILISMGLSQALLLSRYYTLLASLGWLLIHVAVAALLVARPDSRQVLVFLLLLAGSTGSLCWYFYRRSQFQQSALHHLASEEV